MKIIFPHPSYWIPSGLSKDFLGFPGPQVGTCTAVLECSGGLIDGHNLVFIVALTLVSKVSLSARDWAFVDGTWDTSVYLFHLRLVYLKYSSSCDRLVTSPQLYFLKRLKGYFLRETQVPFLFHWLSTVVTHRHVRISFKIDWLLLS